MNYSIGGRTNEDAEIRSTSSTWRLDKRRFPIVLRRIGAVNPILSVSLARPFARFDARLRYPEGSRPPLAGGEQWWRQRATASECGTNRIALPSTPSFLSREHSFFAKSIDCGAVWPVKTDCSILIGFYLVESAVYRLRSALCQLGLCLAVVVAMPCAAQQRIRFPSGSQSIYPGTYPAPPQPTPTPTPQPGAATPWTQVPAPTNGGAVLGQQIQPFDPYSAPAQGFGSSPTIPYTPPTGGMQVAPPGQPLIPSGSGIVLPPVTTPGISPPGPSITFPGQPPPANVPVFPSGPPVTGSSAANIPPYLPPPSAQVPLYGTQPPPLNGSIGPIQPAPIFPNGFGWGNDGAIGYERLFQDTGALYTYLYGDPSSGGNELEINEVEVFTSAVWKNFLHSPHDLRITPGFIFDFSGRSGGARQDCFTGSIVQCVSQFPLATSADTAIRR